MQKESFRFAVGTQYYPVRKNTYLVTITDRLTTRNEAGEVVKTRYVGTYPFMGQTVTDYEITDTEIARGLHNYNQLQEIKP